MGIKANFNSGDIDKIHNEFLDRIMSVIDFALAKASDEILKFAKNTDTYTDRTNNLRSSIGYVVYKNGQRIGASFAKAGVGTEGDGSIGIDKGENYATEIAGNYSDGYVIVLVAGMHYAAYVEAKGYDVISGAALQADNEIENAFNIAAQEISSVTGLDFNLVSN